MADHSVGARQESHESESSQVKKVLLHHQLILVRFVSPSPRIFCVPEGQLKRVKSSTAEKVFLFSVCPFASEG